MELSTFLQKTASIEVDADGEPVRIDYYPRSYTSEVHAMARAIQKAEEDDERLEVANKMMVKLIGGWDFTENGKPLPVSVGSMARLPLLFKQRVMEAIMAAMVPKATTSASSEPTSEAPPEASAPIGISSFERRAS